MHSNVFLIPSCSSTIHVVHKHKTTAKISPKSMLFMYINLYKQLPNSYDVYVKTYLKHDTTEQ